MQKKASCAIVGYRLAVIIMKKINKNLVVLEIYCNFANGKQ